MQTVIKNYHIHLYYTEENISIAKEVAEKADALFDIEVGRFHEKNVGPHPMWSVQLLIKKDDFGQVLGWLSLNRKSLVAFIHPNTGNDLLDHTEHAIWMGAIKDLNINIFK